MEENGYYGEVYVDYDGNTIQACAGLSKQELQNTPNETETETEIELKYENGQLHMKIRSIDLNVNISNDRSFIYAVGKVEYIYESV